MDLKDVSDEDLKAEVERREQLLRQPPNPKPLADVDWCGVYNYVHECVKRAAEDHRFRDDFKHYLYMEVIDAMYGESFSDWRAKQDW